MSFLHKIDHQHSLSQLVYRVGAKDGAGAKGGVAAGAKGGVGAGSIGMRAKLGLGLRVGLRLGIRRGARAGNENNVPLIL